MTRLMLFLLAMFLVSATLAAPPGQPPDPRSKPVQRRQQTMLSAHSAMQTLEAQISGRVRYDRAQADAARKTITTALRNIPRHFRKPVMTAGSNARAEIWSQWPTFKSRAKTARAAASNLKTRNQKTLRRTFPTLVQTCLSCHDQFRISQ